MASSFVYTVTQSIAFIIFLAIKTETITPIIIPIKDKHINIRLRILELKIILSKGCCMPIYQSALLTG